MQRDIDNAPPSKREELSLLDFLILLKNRLIFIIIMAVCGFFIGGAFFWFKKPLFVTTTTASLLEGSEPSQSSLLVAFSSRVFTDALAEGLTASVQNSDMINDHDMRLFLEGGEISRKGEYSNDLKDALLEFFEGNTASIIKKENISKSSPSINITISGVDTYHFVVQGYNARITEGISKLIVPAFSRAAAIYNLRTLGDHEQNLKLTKDDLSLSNSPTRIVDGLSLKNNRMIFETFERFMKLRNRVGLKALYFAGRESTHESDALAFGSIIEAAAKLDKNEREQVMEEVSLIARNYDELLAKKDAISQTRSRAYLQHINKTGALLLSNIDPEKPQKVNTTLNSRSQDGLRYAIFGTFFATLIGMGFVSAFAVVKLNA